METIRAGMALATGLAMSAIDVSDLWRRYFALTGRHSLQDLESYLAGSSEWSPHEHNIAAHALNEYFSERRMNHPMRYAEEV